MPGHKREYDGQFAQIEVGFVLNDPRCTGMTSPEFRYYIFVWCLAVKERMEVLPTWWDAASLQRHCSLDTRTAQKCRSNLLQKCMLGETSNGRLIVCGVKSKHPNLKWKEDRLGGPNGPLKGPQTETETEAEAENRNRKESGKPDDIPYEEIISHLNQVTGKAYRLPNPTKDKIKARWKDGFRLEDFHYVHIIKTKQWKGDAEMERYLRPITLYSNKFEGYRNEKSTEAKHGPTGPTVI